MPCFLSVCRWVWLQWAPAAHGADPRAEAGNQPQVDGAGLQAGLAAGLPGGAAGGRQAHSQAEVSSSYKA